MDLLSTIVAWTYQVLGAWYGAAILGGVLILIGERVSHRRRPSDSDVRQAAAHYRQWYGERARCAIQDHRLAARFAPDGRHGRFLDRVSLELEARDIDRDNRSRR